MGNYSNPTGYGQSYGTSTMPGMGAGQSNRAGQNWGGQQGYQPMQQPQTQIQGSGYPMPNFGWPNPMNGRSNPIGGGMQGPRNMTPAMPPQNSMQGLAPVQSPNDGYAQRGIGMTPQGTLSFGQPAQAPGATGQDPYAYLSPQARAFLGL